MWRSKIPQEIYEKISELATIYPEIPGIVFDQNRKMIAIN